MLRWRLILDPILILALAGLFWADARAGNTAPVLWVLACFDTVRSTWEMVQLLRVRFELKFPCLAMAGVAIVSSNWAWVLTRRPFPGALAGRLGLPMLVFALAVTVLFVRSMIRYRAPGRTIETLGAEVL